MADFGEILTIKDSGDRTRFDTGAVRDMRTGKGRCDLMPLDVLMRAYMTTSAEHTPESRIFYEIDQFVKTRHTSRLIEVLRYAAETIFENYETMFLEVAVYFEEGAKKYGECNWQKGIPVNCYIDSAVRHYLKYLRGDTDERHDRAFVWNIMCCIWTVENAKEKEKEDV